MEDETMMLSEFIERTGFEPMAEEYAEIEEGQQPGFANP